MMHVCMYVCMHVYINTVYTVYTVYTRESAFMMCDEPESPNAGACLTYDEPKSPNEAVAVAAITAAVLLLALSLGCCWFVAAGHAPWPAACGPRKPPWISPLCTVQVILFVRCIYARSIDGI